MKYVFSVIGMLCLFSAAHCHKYTWYIWLVLSLLASFYFFSGQLYCQFIFSLLCGIICILAIWEWSHDSFENITKVTWGNPVAGFILALALFGAIYLAGRQYFSKPLFECMGCSSMLIGLLYLWKRKVSSWMLIGYSAIMFIISSLIINDVFYVIIALSGLVYSFYGLRKYMEYYEQKLN